MEQKEFQMIVGRQVRLHRKAQGFSQERLAELAEVHPTYISNIERGKISASTYGFYKIAEALGIKLVDLFGMIDKGDNLGFESDLVDITGSLRQMDDIQRGLYIAAIKGMLSK